MTADCSRAFALTLLVTAAVSAGLAATADAASVNTVNAKKKVVEVTPDDGETMEKGQTVCIFNEKEKKVGCGKVVSVKNDRILVKVSAGALKKVKEGMSATVSVDSLNEGDDASAGMSSGKSKKAKGKKSAKSKNKVPFRIWADYGKSFLAPATYKKLSYSAPESEPAASLWTSDKTVSDTGGFDLQVGIPLAGFSLNPGVRYHTYTPSVIDSDYYKGRPNPYVSVEQTGTAYGVFVDFAFLRAAFSKAIAFNLASGLDVDISSVKVDAKNKTDDAAAAPIAHADKLTLMTSNLTVISLRLGFGFDFMFAGAFGGHLGLNGMVPITANGSVSGGFADDENRGVDDTGADLKNALAHKKGGFAAELVAGLMLAF